MFLQVPLIEEIIIKATCLDPQQIKAFSGFNFSSISGIKSKSQLKKTSPKGYVPTGIYYEGIYYKLTLNPQWQWYSVPYTNHWLAVLPFKCNLMDQKKPTIPVLSTVLIQS
jgi:hypothetical protein